MAQLPPLSASHYVKQNRSGAYGFQGRRQLRELRLEQKCAALEYREQKTDVEREQAEARERRARARTEGATRSRRKAQQRSKRRGPEQPERVSQSQGNQQRTRRRGSEEDTAAVEELLTSEERAQLAKWELQHRGIEEEERIIDAKMRRRALERQRPAPLAAAAGPPARMMPPAKRGLFSFAPMSDAELCVQPELDEHTEWLKETATQRCAALKSLSLAQRTAAAEPLANDVELDLIRNTMLRPLPSLPKGTIRSDEPSQPRIRLPNLCR